MKTFTEADRYNYPVQDGWIVMDVGAHYGEFALGFTSQHRVKQFLMRSYEPVVEFFEIAKERLKGTSVNLLPFGLAGTTRRQMFRVKGDMTGPWANEGPTQVVDLVGIEEEVEGSLPEMRVDLLKINIEGGEYELLEAILDQGLAPIFRHLQIQFHFIPDINPVDRWNKIRERLAQTHTLEYGDPSMEFQQNTWEGWTIK